MSVSLLCSVCASASPPPSPLDSSVQSPPHRHSPVWCYRKFVHRCAQADPHVLGQIPAVSAALWCSYDAESHTYAREEAAMLLRLLAETCGALDPTSWISACKLLATMTSRSLQKVSCSFSWMGHKEGLTIWAHNNRYRTPRRDCLRQMQVRMVR
jgi:hypothetical protein